jgi:hypothetical protein
MGGHYILPRLNYALRSLQSIDSEFLTLNVTAEPGASAVFSDLNHFAFRVNSCQCLCLGPVADDESSTQVLPAPFTTSLRSPSTATAAARERN